MGGGASAGGGACTVVVSTDPIGVTMASLPPVVVVVVVVLVLGAGPLSGSSPEASARAEIEASRPMATKVLQTVRASMRMRLRPTPPCDQNPQRI